MSSAAISIPPPPNFLQTRGDPQTKTPAMPPPSSHLVLLDRSVDIMPFPAGYGTTNIQRRVLTTGAKQAFGFVWHDEASSAVRGLELEAHHAGETDLSRLTLRGCDQNSGISTIDKNLILITSAFLQVHHCDVFLIYDATDSSLSMIPSMPYTYPSIRTPHVLVARRHKDGDDDDSDNSYALVYPGTDGGKEVLFLAFSTFREPWKITRNVKFPDHSLQFLARDVFSFRGRGYWADLLLGVVFYCDYNDVLNLDGECIHISSFDLPVGYKISDLKDGRRDERPFRTMGPAGDSIKFVSIDGYFERELLQKWMVRVWRLMEDMNWALEYEFNVASLFETEFVYGWVPAYPFLSRDEGNAIYLSLGTTPFNRNRMVRLDLISGTYSCTPLSISQRTCMDCHVALSLNAMDKLFRGSFHAEI